MQLDLNQAWSGLLTIQIVVLKSRCLEPDQRPDSGPLVLILVPLFTYSSYPDISNFRRMFIIIPFWIRNCT
jgi:hypothetical protein